MCMHCTRKIIDNVYWVGGNDRRLAMFEGIYSVPAGVSYNAYVLLDEKIAVMDTVDTAVAKVYFENLEYVLGGLVVLCGGVLLIDFAEKR